MENNISHKIKTARLSKNCTQKRLAELTGIAEITIRQYELGKYAPKYDKLQKIASALEVDINSLLEDTRSPLEKAMDSQDSSFAKAFQQSLPIKGIEFTSDDIGLINVFHQLNADGQNKVTEYAIDLSNNSQYKRHS